jgi:hydroxyethylthiazole kinase-like uncharacterized protein yjeF
MTQPQPEAIDITPQRLRDWPLPLPDADGDKEDRGRLLIVGGSSELPGALVLAADAALRAGAGKLVLATAATVAGALAIRIPEARVIGLPETEQRGLVLDDAARLPSHFDAVLIGPGLQDEPAAKQLVSSLRAHIGAPFILDALAMSSVVDTRFKTPVLLTPHAGEMSHLTGIAKESVCDEAARIAREWAQRWQANVALKGPTTYIAKADGKLWRYCSHNPGLAVSGSGDVLAGIIAGLAARGAALEQAAAWGVALHAAAGDALANTTGPLGFLARELPAQIPALLQEFTGAR